MTSTPVTSTDLRVPCDVLSVAVVRRRFAAELLDAGCTERFVDGAALVLSELLMNAIVHGVPDDDDQVGARWEFDGETLTVQVTDSGTGAGGNRIPHVEAPDLTEGGGRGLHLVERLSEHWSTAPTADGGTGVTAVLSAKPGPDAPPA